MAKIHDLNSNHVQFKESFFRMKKLRKQNSFIDSLKNIRPDSKIIEFYKTKNYADIVDRELGICPRETQIKNVKKIFYNNNKILGKRNSIN